MFGNEYSEEQRPITYFQGYPIYAATLLVGIFGITLLVTTLLMASGYGAVCQNFLKFDTTLVLGEKQIWRFLTYGFWNIPSIPFVIDMAMFIWFGREVEKFLGRKVFLRFYIILYFLQPLVATVLGFIRPTVLLGETGAFAFFLAFATLYPNTALLFNILAKWMAIVLVGIYTLMALASQDVVGLITLWVTVGYTYGFIRYEQGQLALPKIPWPSRKPKFRVVPRPQDGEGDARSATAAEMDALLDKIARSGMASLTAKEKARLEQAREDLLRKDKR